MQRILPEFRRKRLGMEWPGFDCIIAFILMHACFYILPIDHSNCGIVFFFLFLGVITRVLQSICHVNKPPEMTQDECLGFKVYPPNGFYAVPWPKWEMFFDPKKLNETLNMTKDSIVIHVWNKHSIKRKLKVGTKAAYGLAAEMNCPLVYRSCGDYF